jgi:hypothetical protein
MRMIHPVFHSLRIKIIFFYLLPGRFLLYPPLQYHHGSFSVGQIGVGIGMRGRDQRYINDSCPFDINEISCMSHVCPTQQLIVHVFRLEKRIPTGKPYLSAHCASGATTSILFGGNCVIVSLPRKPIYSKYYYTSMR